MFVGLGLFPICLIALPSIPIFGGTKHWLTAYPFLALLAAMGWGRLWWRARMLLREWPQLLHRAPVVMLIAVLAAVISTADSQLLVSSVALTEDFYRAFLNRRASDRALVWVGRGTVVLVILVAFVVALRGDALLGIVAHAWAGWRDTRTAFDSGRIIRPVEQHLHSVLDNCTGAVILSNPRTGASRAPAVAAS